MNIILDTNIYLDLLDTARPTSKQNIQYSENYGKLVKSLK